MILVFDVETSDMPDWSASADEMTARIVELAAVLLDPVTLVPVEAAFCELIQPDGWEIQPGAGDVNKITMEMCHEHGIPIAEAIEEFDRMADRATVLVGFSMRFDNKFVRSERRRLGRPDRYGLLPELDVMWAARPFCNAKDKNGKAKAPSLVEAYTQLVGGDFPEAHTALADVEATADVLRVLRDKWKVDISGKMPTSKKGKPPAKARAPKPAKIEIDLENPKVF